jgi:serine/threonine-protein kinase RsbW
VPDVSAALRAIRDLPQLMAPVRHAQETPATPEAVGALRRWVERQCQAAGVAVEQCADITLAVSEALSNVVMHAYVERDGPGPMRIRTEHDDHRLLVEVEDEGVGMRPRTDSPGAGLGLTLIATVAAELELARGPSGDGVLVRMAFALR